MRKVEGIRRTSLGFSAHDLPLPSPPPPPLRVRRIATTRPPTLILPVKPYAIRPGEYKNVVREDQSLTSAALHVESM